MTTHRSELNRLLGQLETQITHLNQNLKHLKLTFQKLGERVSSLEMYFSFWRGGLGALILTGSVLSVMLQLFLSYSR